MDCSPRYVLHGQPHHYSRHPKRDTRLVRRTVLIALLLVSGSLLSSSSIELIFHYRESMENLRVGQQVMADNAALQVQRFIEEIHHRLQDQRIPRISSPLA